MAECAVCFSVQSLSFYGYSFFSEVQRMTNTHRENQLSLGEKPSGEMT